MSPPAESSPTSRWISATWFLSALVIPAVVYGLVAKFRGGQTAPVRESLRWGRRQWGKTLWNMFKVEVTVALWGLLLVIPGLVAMVRLIFADVIVAIEADRETEVLARSRVLSKGHGWRIFLVLLPLMAAGLVGDLPGPRRFRRRRLFARGHGGSRQPAFRGRAVDHGGRAADVPGGGSPAAPAKPLR